MTYKRKEVIGDCTLYLGDCLEVMPSLSGVDAVVTDPPYGMSFVSSFRREETKHKEILNDKDENILHKALNFPFSHSAYFFCRWNNLVNIPKTPQSVITWVKNNHSMGDLKHEHARQAELILFYKGKNHFFPKKRPNDIIKAPRTGNDFHPSQKPIDLMGAVIEWTDGMIADPFMGSGTTLVACAKMKRKGIGIELDEKYFDIACKRVDDAYKQTDLFY